MPRTAELQRPPENGDGALEVALAIVQPAQSGGGRGEVQRLLDGLGDPDRFLTTHDALSELPHLRQAQHEAVPRMHGGELRQAEALVRQIAHDGFDVLPEQGCRRAVLAESEMDLSDVRVRRDF